MWKKWVCLLALVGTSSACDGTKTAGGESSCGDGKLSAAEVCDGTQFGELSCETFGYAGGVLTCDADCGGYSFVACSFDGTTVEDTPVETPDEGESDGPPLVGPEASDPDSGPTLTPAQTPVPTLTPGLPLNLVMGFCPGVPVNVMRSVPAPWGMTRFVWMVFACTGHQRLAPKGAPLRSAPRDLAAGSWKVPPRRRFVGQIVIPMLVRGNAMEMRPVSPPMTWSVTRAVESFVVVGKTALMMAIRWTLRMRLFR